MAGLCELRIEPSEPTKGGKFVGALSDCQFLHNNVDLVSQLISFL
jgi:hypothetical protein